MAAVVEEPEALSHAIVDERAAEEAKAQGNELFQAAKFAQAEQAYTKAITFNPNNPVYYSNRAFCHIRLENYGSAIADATHATELDANFIKAYYRRGSAYCALGRYKEALKDFQRVVKIAPKDADANAKLKECKKQVQRQAFEEAIATEAPRSAMETTDVDVIEVEASYAGLTLPAEVTGEWAAALMEEFKAGRKLHRKFVLQILKRVRALLERTPTLLDITFPAEATFTVCGDTHGQFYDLCNIFQLNGQPAETNPYLFNGDFVDRGSWSVEVMLALFAWKLAFPDHFHLLRGNHESKSLNKIYGFEGEVKAKYDDTTMLFFTEVFCLLPLAATLNRKVFVCHGGLFSKDGVTLADIAAINRNMEPPETGLMAELLWADPHPLPGRRPSKRGVGLSFGPDVTQRFLESNGLDLIVRSHEMKEEGYEVEHDGKLITIFSAPNYCDQSGNKGAFIRFRGGDMRPQFTQFSAVPHPPIRPMAYASNMSLFGL